MRFPRQEYGCGLLAPSPAASTDVEFLKETPRITTVPNVGLPLWLQLVKNPPAMRAAWVRSLGWEDPPEKGKATHSSILAWRVPWTL